MNEEERNFEQTKYQERLLYGAELTRRIAIVYDTIDRYEYAFEPVENLVSLLLPEIRKEISIPYEKMTVGYQNQIRRFTYPTTTLPVPARRNQNPGELIYSERLKKVLRLPPKKEFRPFDTHKNRGMDWNDLSPQVRVQIFHYFPPGSVVQTEHLLKISYYPFARALLNRIVAIADRMGLLLASSKAVEVGGGFGAQHEQF